MGFIHYMTGPAPFVFKLAVFSIVLIAIYLVYLAPYLYIFLASFVTLFHYDHLLLGITLFLLALITMVLRHWDFSTPDYSQDN